MRLVIAAIGRLKDGPERELYARYSGRVAGQGRAVALGPLDLNEIPESRAAAAEARMAEEAGRLVSKVATVGQRILLDEGARAVSSRELAEMLREARDGGTDAVAFLIGGPDGHGATAREAATRAVSLGRITLPHGLARVVLAEQLYRAVTIVAGHPYHRD